MPAEFDDSQAVARDTADLTLTGLDDIRGNITLPAAGEFGSAITWAAIGDHHPDRRSDPAGLRAARRRAHADRHDRQGRGRADQVVRRPRSRRMPRTQDPERYFLGYFTGEGLADGEQLRFGLSTGNSALDWVGLGGGKPVAGVAAGRSGPA